MHIYGVWQLLPIFYTFIIFTLFYHANRFSVEIGPAMVYGLGWYGMVWYVMVWYGVQVPPWCMAYKKVGVRTASASSFCSVLYFSLWPCNAYSIAFSHYGPSGHKSEVATLLSYTPYRPTPLLLASHVQHFELLALDDGVVLVCFGSLIANFFELSATNKYICIRRVCI